MNTRTSMLTNLISSLNSSDELILIGRHSDTKYVLDYPAHEWSQINNTALSVEVSTRLTEEQCDYYELMVTVPWKEEKDERFISYLAEVNPEVVDNVRSEFPNSSEGVSDEAILEMMETNRRRIWEKEGCEYSNPVFFPIIKKLGGFEAVKENRVLIVELAEAALTNKINLDFMTPRKLQAQGYCPELGMKMASAFADVH